MQYRITAERGHLKAKLHGRETAVEMLEFVRALVSENARLQHATILIDVRASRPIFHFAGQEFMEELKKISSEPLSRIALLGDTVDLRLSNDYLAILARQQGLNLRSFRSEVAALKWLSERRNQERRNRSERREILAQRDESLPRRRQQRRSHREGIRPSH
jgi:hypothetical protein